VEIVSFSQGISEELGGWVLCFDHCRIDWILLLGRLFGLRDDFRDMERVEGSISWRSCIVLMYRTSFTAQVVYRF
jgi:hypothetical protein